MFRDPIHEQTTRARVSARDKDYVTIVWMLNHIGYHNRVSSRLLRHHPCIWDLIKFLQREEKRVASTMLQWSSGASQKKNHRSTAAQSRIKTLYKRYNENLINESALLTGLSFVVARRVK